MSYLSSALRNPLALLFFLYALAGCEGNSKIFNSTVDIQKRGITSIHLAVNNPQDIIELGQELTFSVTGIDKSNNTIPIKSKDVDWSVHCDPGNCAIITESGTLKSFNDGRATVTATYGPFTESHVVTISSAELQDITIEAIASDPYDFCRPYQVLAKGRYEGESALRDITALADWRVTAGEGQVYRNTDNNIYFSIGAAAPLTIAASHRAFSGNQVEGQNTFATTADSRHPQLEIFPDLSNVRVYIGYTKQFSAKGTYDTTTLDLTQHVKWESRNTNALTFSNETTAFDITQRKDGLATGVGAGEPTIVASCTQDAVATKTVIVREPVVTGLRIIREGDIEDHRTQSPYIIGKSTTVKFRAYPIFQDDDSTHTGEVTLQSTWESDGGDRILTFGNSSQIDPSDPNSQRGQITSSAQTGTEDVRVEYQVQKPDGSYPRATFQVIVE